MSSNNIKNKHLKNQEDKKKNKHSENQEDRKNKIISFIFSIISLIIIIACGLYIVMWIMQNNANEQTIKEIYEDTVSVDDETGTSKIDFGKLKNRNKDVIGWLKVNNTNIDYPIVKGNDNDFYIKHNFDKNYNIAGWVFADYRLKADGTDKNIVIYGHNMKNGSMFGSLKKVLTKEWYENEDNMYVTFETEEQVLTYKVFSVYQIKKETYYTTTSFRSAEAYQNFLNTLKSRSIKKFNEDVSTDDKILTLSTCASNNDYRVVLHAYLCDI